MFACLPDPGAAMAARACLFHTCGVLAPPLGGEIMPIHMHVVAQNHPCELLCLPMFRVPALPRGSAGSLVPVQLVSQSDYRVVGTHFFTNVPFPSSAMWLMG